MPATPLENEQPPLAPQPPNWRSEMRVTWLTQFEGAPFVRYGLAEDELDAQVPANVTTYTAADLCGAPANSTGWKAPGTINSGVMADLEPNTRYYYVVGDEAANTTSTVSSFISAPGPDDTVKLLAFADVGQYNEDGTKGFGYWYDTYGLFDEVYAIGTLQYTALQAVLVTLSQQADQDGTILVYPALIEEASTGEYHSAWHNGDVSYARGMAWQWDTFGHLMEPLSSRVPTMYSPGNHEYDWPTAHDSQFAEAIDSGGECGVPYKMRAPMPTVSSDDLFYSIDHGPIHFLQLNTEARFDEDSEQYKFVVRDLFTVDRSKTPWVVVGFHRMMYTDAFDGVSEASAQRVAAEMRDVFEAMFVYFGVDMTWQGHNHVYQRTCPVFNNTCVGYDKEGVARGPIHVTMGHAGFMLSPSYQPVEAAAFADTPELAFFGYCRAEVNRTHFNLQMLDALNQTVRDEIRLYKPLGWELDVNATQALISDTPGAPFTDNPTNAGFKYIISTIFPKLLLSDIVGALSIIGQGTPIYAKLNAHPSRPISAEFMTQTAQSVIDFVTPLVNATNLQEIAGAALPMSAEAIMESFDWVASAWKGRIAELVGAQDYAEA
ncbi:hypothetical protein ACKKBG_A29540 [Auxenochlorella protothecoides x Auxenochlorella symbiontica]